MGISIIGGNNTTGGGGPLIDKSICEPLSKYTVENTAYPTLTNILNLNGSGYLDYFIIRLHPNASGDSFAQVVVDGILYAHLKLNNYSHNSGIVNQELFAHNFISLSNSGMQHYAPLSGMLTAIAIPSKLILPAIVLTNSVISFPGSIYFKNSLQIKVQTSTGGPPYLLYEYAGGVMP